MYIILREENQYDQYGEYFVAAFSKKPTLEELQKLEDFVFITLAKHVLNGGGRRGNESTWYTLREYKEGTLW